MIINKARDSTKLVAASKKKKDSVLSPVTPALCVDFHQTVSLSQAAFK